MDAEDSKKPRGNKVLPALPATPRYIAEKRRDLLLRDKRTPLHLEAMELTSKVEAYFLRVEDLRAEYRLTATSTSHLAVLEKAAALLQSVGWVAFMDHIEGELVVRFPRTP
jgi:hypothetical protein